ncbi:MAG: hypothetical protein RI949_3133 [Pseudomonadota bacterium]
MSTPYWPDQSTPASILCQLHQLQMLVRIPDTDWEDHVRDWFEHVWLNIERGFVNGCLDPIRPHECMQVGGPARTVKTFSENWLSGWARVAGALAYHFDDDDPVVMDRSDYVELLDWCFKEIANGSDMPDDFLTGWGFKDDLDSFAKEWGVPARYAVPEAHIAEHLKRERPEGPND